MKHAFFLAAMVGLASPAVHADLAVIGTLNWAGSSGPAYNLIYDDNGRRRPNGTIGGGLIWLDRTYQSNEMQFDAALGTGENARFFADALNRQGSAAIITLRPGYTIASWDSGWRLPHSGTNPTSNPQDSEMLHLMRNELANNPGSPVLKPGVFQKLLVQTPAYKGSGFFGYWLDQSKETVKGTEIWFNTANGWQETVPAAFSGGYAIFVRSATVAYNPAAPGTPDTNAPVMTGEGHTVSSGSSVDIDAYQRLYAYSPAAGHSSADIVGIGIAGSDDHVYVWYRDGTVSSGNSADLDYYRAPYGYALPPGKTPADIVGIGIAGSNDHVYAWYRDGTVSAGTTSNLAAYRPPYAYALPSGKTSADIVGIGIAGSDDHVYAWYGDGTVSSGTTSNLAAYRAPSRYTLPPGKTPADIVEMGIAGSNDHVYAWYRPTLK